MADTRLENRTRARIAELTRMVEAIDAVLELDPPYDVMRDLTAAQWKLATQIDQHRSRVDGQRQSLGSVPF